MEIMKGDNWSKHRRQRQPRAAQNGDHEGRQMKQDKAAAAAKSRPESTRRQRQPRAAQNGDHAGRQMKQDKAAAAAKSSPELMEITARTGSSGSQEQPRMEFMKGDKRSPELMEIMKGDKCS